MSEPRIWAISSPSRPFENLHTTIFFLFMISKKSRDRGWPMIGMMDGRSSLPTLLIGGENLDICSESRSFGSQLFLEHLKQRVFGRSEDLLPELVVSHESEDVDRRRMIVVLAYGVDGVDDYAR